jgi:hypothetical protein
VGTVWKVCKESFKRTCFCRRHLYIKIQAHPRLRPRHRCRPPYKRRWALLLCDVLTHESIEFSFVSSMFSRICSVSLCSPRIPRHGRRGYSRSEAHWLCHSQHPRIALSSIFSLIYTFGSSSILVCCESTASQVHERTSPFFLYNKQL